MANSQTDSGSEEEYLYIRYPRHRVEFISTRHTPGFLNHEPHSRRSPSRWSVHTSNFGSAVDNSVWYRDHDPYNRPTPRSTHTSDADSAIDDGDVISLQSLDDDTVPLLTHHNNVRNASSAPADRPIGQIANNFPATDSGKSHNHIWGEDKLPIWKRKTTKRSFKHVLGKGLLHKLQKSNLKLNKSITMKDEAYLPVDPLLSSTMSFLDYKEQEPQRSLIQPERSHVDKTPEPQGWCNTAGKPWVETNIREVSDGTGRRFVTVDGYKLEDTLRLDPSLNAARIDGYQQDDRRNKSTQQEFNAMLDRNEFLYELPTTVTHIEAQPHPITDESDNVRYELVRAASEPVMSDMPSGRTVQPTAATVVEHYLSEISESPSTAQVTSFLKSKAPLRDFAKPAQKHPQHDLQDSAETGGASVTTAKPLVIGEPTSAKTIPTARFLQSERTTRVPNIASPPMFHVGRPSNKNTSKQPAKPIRYPVPPPKLSENDDGVLAAWLRAQSEWRAKHCKVSTAAAEPTTLDGGSQSTAGAYKNCSPMAHRPLPSRPAIVPQRAPAESLLSIDITHTRPSPNLPSSNALASTPRITQRTIYAGTGWVSPHPLSVASVGQRSPPQSSIELPSGGRLTYARFLEMRNNAASPEMGEAGEVRGRGHRRSQHILSMPWDQNSS